MNRTASKFWSFAPNVFDGVRRLEAVSLVAFGLLLVVLYGPVGMMGASVLLGTAVLLMPKERTASRVTHEERRLQLLIDMHSEAMDLRSEYISARSQPLSEARARELWQVRRQIIVWLANSKARLRGFAEFAAIYEARTDAGGVLHELDCAMSCLSELKQLSTLSKKLRLPI